jgi:hypothetical protein
MAATNYTPISLYYSATASNVPTNTNLVNGELAINIADGKLFYKDSSNVVQVIATKSGASGDVVGPASATDNAFARFDLTTGKLIQNSSATLDDNGAPTFVGSVVVSGTAAAAADIKLYEDTDNGTNYVALQSPASVASNVTFTLPAADGSSGQAIVTDGSGNLSFGSAGISTGKSIAMAMIFGF